ncbi:MAG TPA: sulfatase-like hydrolase/transferase [Polyangiaceae bacterium]|nr:sulfatase-like hydrolase/transferase [Polyangiaceae bacterium]
MSVVAPQFRSVVVDAAAVLATWAGLLVTEDVVLGFLYRDDFAGGWEVALARHTVVPMAVAALAPAALAAVAGFRAARGAASGSRAAAVGLAVVGGVGAAVVALGVSQGRHFAHLGVRGPFVVALAAAGAWVVGRAVPRVSALVERPPFLAALAAGLVVGSWLVDAYVLPRLYPAFHAALLVATLAFAAVVALAVRAAEGPPGPVAYALSGAVGLGWILCVAGSPRAARALDPATNLRIVLVERAPLLGPAVAIVTRVRPPVDEVASTQIAAPTPAAPGRSLDWTGHDIVLISVDALRADHVSAYGYPRPTTPNLDALAREGALFEGAYCPTPHTSYSVTSMMTGKYLRPLLTLGLGEDSETWAQDLRRYGWRTAAFYPPAVFFIDEARFAVFEREHLGFEYAKVEFAEPALREEQIREYLSTAPTDRPLFLWVHFFEPHEPYVPHPDHVFTGGPSADVDAYDGEVAEADDGIGRVVRLVRSRRPDSVFWVTADHGEEFGEHGGRYHGTTVYEEQVRVPLVVVGPGVRAGARIASVVQTIDLLPTTLSAIAIPRPARVRGRDLGPLLAGGPGQEEGLAFAETDDYALLAAGPDRLVCDRRAAACALYRPQQDPLERRDFGGQDPARLAQLRGWLRATEKDHGRYEAAAGPTWPEALRRGLQGEVDAAVDVASLLDDVDPAVRRKAAEVCFLLHADATGPQVRRALAGDEDDEVRRWLTLAAFRMGTGAIPPVEALLRDPSRDWRRRAALVLAERGDARGCQEVTAWWGDLVSAAEPDVAAEPDGEPMRLPLELPRVEELLTATVRARCRSAVPSLDSALQDVRARPSVADALGALGDARSAAPLRALLARETYVTARPHEARALEALGVRDWAAVGSPPAEVHTSVSVPAGRVRLIVHVSDAHADLEAKMDDVAGEAPAEGGEVRSVEFRRAQGRRARLDLRVSSGGVVGAWIFAGRVD